MLRLAPDSFLTEERRREGECWGRGSRRKEWRLSNGTTVITLKAWKKCEHLNFNAM